MTTPVDPTPAQIAIAINNLQAQITFLYKHLGILVPQDGTKIVHPDARRTESGMGAILNSNSDFT